MREINTIVTMAKALVSSIQYGELKRLDIQSFNSLECPFVGYVTIGDIREEYSNCTIEYSIYSDGTISKEK